MKCLEQASTSDTRTLSLPPHHQSGSNEHPDCCPADSAIECLEQAAWHYEPLSWKPRPRSRPADTSGWTFRFVSEALPLPPSHAPASKQPKVDTHGLYTPWGARGVGGGGGGGTTCEVLSSGRPLRKYVCPALRRHSGARPFVSGAASRVQSKQMHSLCRR